MSQPSRWSTGPLTQRHPSATRLPSSALHTPARRLRHGGFPYGIAGSGLQWLPTPAPAPLMSMPRSLSVGVPCCPRRALGPVAGPQDSRQAPSPGQPWGTTVSSSTLSPALSWRGPPGTEAPETPDRPSDWSRQAGGGGCSPLPAGDLKEDRSSLSFQAPCTLVCLGSPRPGEGPLLIFSVWGSCLSDNPIDTLLRTSALLVHRECRMDTGL